MDPIEIYLICMITAVYHCLHKLMSKKDGHLTLLVDIVKVLLDHDRSLGKMFGQSKCDSSDNCGD